METQLAQLSMRTGMTIEKISDLDDLLQNCGDTTETSAMADDMEVDKSGKKKDKDTKGRPMSNPQRTTRSNARHTTRKAPNPEANQAGPSKILEPTLLPPTQEQSLYHLYINSSDFKTDSVTRILKQCFEFSKKEEQPIKNFWQDHYQLFRRWIDTGKRVQVRMIFNFAPEGIMAIRTCMCGVEIGTSIEKDEDWDEHIELVQDISKILEASGIMIQRWIKGFSAHQEQTLEFVQQVNNASEIVSKISTAVEQIKLEAVRLQIKPRPSMP